MVKPMIRTIQTSFSFKQLLALLFLVTSILATNTAFAQRQSSLPINNGAIIYDAVVENYGRVAYRGDIDLTPHLDRIEQGERDSHRNDGSTFGNRERLLPIMQDRNYYKEYVVRTPNISGVGPQRLVIGKGGEIYYTPDHYESFIELRLEEQATVFDTPAIDAPLKAARPQLSSSDSLIISDIAILDLDKNVAYRGDIDLAPVINRIEAGEFDPHRSDGTPFDNRDGILPKKPEDYYLMYIVRTPGMSGVGPQRLIIGENWESYYTPDFFASFIDVSSALGSAPAPELDGLTVRFVTILDDNDNVIFSGDMDLEASLERIANGESDSYRSDGGTFSNREGLLPQKDDRNYYTMFVVRTPDFDDVGPQRLVIGKGSEVYYTPDHFESFIHLNP